VKLTTFVEDGATLTLRERDGAFDLVLGNVVLLSSAALETELDFGRLAGSIAARSTKRVMVGGLGFGATARGVLEALPDVRVTIVEKLATVENLVRGELAHLAHGVLDDPRVELVRGDAADAIERARGEYDAILLDTDNGPNWASFRSNARLYGSAGLASAMRALSPGGAIAVWSGYAADAFLAQLRAAGFIPSVTPFRERGVVRARAYVGKKP
jgi:spermidine synthase